MLLCCMLVAAGCKTVEVRKQRVVHKDKGYSIDLPSPEWKLASADEKAVVAHNKRIGGTLALLVSDKKETKATVDILGRKLFYGMKNRTFTKRSEMCKLSGHDAAYSELAAEVDGAAVKIAAYSVEAGKFFYDVVYFAPPDQFDTGKPDFERLARSLKFAKQEAK